MPQAPHTPSKIMSFGILHLIALFYKRAISFPNQLIQPNELNQRPHLYLCISTSYLPYFAASVLPPFTFLLNHPIV
jgi:hypothetical protein